MYDPTITQKARAAQNDAGTFSPHPSEAHQPAAGGEQGKQGPDVLALLREALTEPGRISKAYSLFHRYSIGNALWIAEQLEARGEPLAPIASFKRWQELGRQVRKGSKAIAMYMPVTVKDKAEQDGQSDKQDDAEHKRRLFIVRRNWFALHQTEPKAGSEAQAIETQAPEGWEPARALQALGITREAFEHVNGNVQGYARPNARALAINPMAAEPIKTLCHEIAHCLLHAEQAQIDDGAELDRSAMEVEAESVAYLVCATLGTGDLASSRAYIQGWLSGASADDFTAKHARRVIGAADRILKAGRPTEQAADETEG
jgi:antirestriction protein ArdC